MHGLLAKPAFFPPTNDERRTAETNRSRQERRQLRLQLTTPEQVCFVAAAQVGELQTRIVEKATQAGKNVGHDHQRRSQAMECPCALALSQRVLGN
jgi:hypothetical protein